MPSKDQFLKRLRKKAKKGMRGWPVATIAFYGPNLSQATKVAVGIVPTESAEPREVRDWKVENGDVIHGCPKWIGRCGALLPLFRLVGVP